MPNRRISQLPNLSSDKWPDDIYSVYRDSGTGALEIMPFSALRGSDYRPTGDFPGFAFVSEMDGNDSTAAIGKPYLPYKTLSAALSNTPSACFLMGGNLGNATLYNSAISFISIAPSVIGTLTLSPGISSYYIVKCVTSHQSLTITEINASGAPNISANHAVYSLYLYNLNVSSIIANGGTDTGGGTAGNTNVGGGSDILLDNCLIGSIEANGANGDKKTVTSAGSYGGNAGIISSMMRTKVTGTITLNAGKGGDANDGSGQSGGNAGNAGSISMKYSEILGAITLSGAKGGKGSGGGSDGNDSIGGSITALFSKIGDVSANGHGPAAGGSVDLFHTAAGTLDLEDAGNAKLVFSTAVATVGTTTTTNSAFSVNNCDSGSPTSI